MKRDLDQYLLTDTEIRVEGYTMRITGFGDDEAFGQIYEGEDEDGNIFEVDMNGKVVTINGEERK